MEHTLAVAAQIANRRTAELALQARPDSPTILDPDAVRPTPDQAGSSIRHHASVLLHRLADRLDTRPGRASLPGGAC